MKIYILQIAMMTLQIQLMKQLIKTIQAYC